jgi:hypothetical protein
VNARPVITPHAGVPEVDQEPVHDHVFGVRCRPECPRWGNQTPQPGWEQPQDWYFTFGWDHHHPITGQPLRKSYVRIHGTCDSTREEMLAVFGNRWSQQYSPADKARAIDRFNLVEVPMPGMEPEEEQCSCGEQHSAQEWHNLGMVCGRCGQHTGNNNQGHYWKVCNVKATEAKAKGIKGLDAVMADDHHFCCPPPFGCSLAERPAGDDDEALREVYAQDEADQDRVPTQAGFDAWKGLRRAVGQGVPPTTPAEARTGVSDVQAAVRETVASTRQYLARLRVADRENARQPSEDLATAADELAAAVDGCLDRIEQWAGGGRR